MFNTNLNNFLKIKKIVIAGPIIFCLLFFAENCWKIKYFGESILDDLFYRHIASFIIIITFCCSNSFTILFKKNSYSQFKNIWILFLLSLTISTIYGSYYIYNQPIINVIKSYYWYSGIIIYFILIKFFPSQEKAQEIFHIIIWYGVVATIFSIVCSVFDLNIFYMKDIEDFKRFGLTRVAGFAENGIIILFYYSLFSVFIKKNKYSSFNRNTIIIKLMPLWFVITIITILFVMMTRQVIISLLITIFLIIFSKIIKKNHRKIFIIFGISIAIIIVISLLPNILKLIDPFEYQSTESNETKSFSLRVMAIAYYYSLFIDTNGFGFGWFSITNDINENILSYATNFLDFRLADLGIFATLFQFGIFGVIIIILFYKKYLGIIKNANCSQKLIENQTLKYFIFFKIFQFNYNFYWPLFTIFFGIIAYIVEEINRFEN